MNKLNQENNFLGITLQRNKIDYSSWVLGKFVVLIKSFERINLASILIRITFKRT